MFLVPKFTGFEEQIAGWTFEDRKSGLTKGTDKVRIEYCLDDENRIQYMRSVQGHSGQRPIDPKLQK